MITRRIPRADTVRAIRVIAEARDHSESPTARLASQAASNRLVHGRETSRFDGQTELFVQNARGRVMGQGFAFVLSQGDGTPRRAYELWREWLLERRRSRIESA